MTILTRVSVLCISAILCACQPTVYKQMPEPIADQRGDYDLTPDDENNGSIVIGYATNRVIDTSGPGNYNAVDFDLDLRFGDAFIQMGSGEESWEEILDLALTSERQEPIPLTLTGVYRKGRLAAQASVSELPPDIQRLMDELNAYIDNSLIKGLTIYVHGAITSFYRGAAYGAQYRHFSGRVSPVLLYAWPSTASLLSYGKGVKNIEASVPAFVRFIELVTRQSSAEKINVIAYSAGAQLVTKALAVVASSVPG